MIRFTFWKMNPSGCSGKEAWKGKDQRSDLARSCYKKSGRDGGGPDGSTGSGSPRPWAVWRDLSILQENTQSDQVMV